jgi:predicted DNA-binding transcriptional regulator YafY
MRRADRLFQIVQVLQHRRLTTAATLADRLQVSERTVYRDIRDLTLSGVPIQGEAGVGYRMGKNFELPPLMFDKGEIQALVLGARMVESWGDAELRRAAQSVLEKVEAALPPADRPRMHDTALFSVSFHVPKIVRQNLAPLRQSIDERRRLHLVYQDGEERKSDRTVRPLGLYFWGNRWTLGAWCELREDFRNFRLDRIESAQPLDETFELVSPVTLDDYLKSMTGD